MDAGAVFDATQLFDLARRRGSAVAWEIADVAALLGGSLSDGTDGGALAAVAEAAHRLTALLVATGVETEIREV